MPNRKRSTGRTGSAIKKCSFCRRNPRRPNQRTCRPCHAKSMRAYRFDAAVRKEEMGGR